MKKIINAQARMHISFPKELYDFYTEVGYGFFNRESDSAINRLIDPESVADIRLREDEFEYDPDLDMYEDLNKLVFFEVVEGLYFSISVDENDKNAIYYVDTIIAESLEEFLKRLDQEGDYFYDLIG